ncbi:thioesterase II family protein [Amycolatopsis sp. GM8]|uniref:thioesterase II family protein n=1 Tax=Amycolatopsis sp. GM8 TaxID=2896530 RepID=UPI001F39FE11|nr:alpha/beta fold hydrolase [Amycolatopsis sp. GM8]
MTASTTWLRQEPSTAAVRLVCLPHAGAGATSFTRWLPLFPPEIAPVRVQLPGREDVVARPPLLSMAELLDGLLPQVSKLDAPIALYGHSMGALVAFELARALETPPMHLFVSGRRAPRLPSRKSPIHDLPDEEFGRALAARGLGGIGHAAFQRYALPLIKADLTVSEDYEYQPAPPLPCPLTVFYGNDDPIVERDQAEAWSVETAGAFALHTFPGDHFFHHDHRAAIVAVMSEALE